MTIRLPRLRPEPDSPFPPADTAKREPNGLLAFGGDLSERRLLNAYRQGIFPWYSHGEPILWWSPDPRMVFDTATFRLPSRLRRSLKRSTWLVCADTDFATVVSACAHTPRPGRPGTWITPEMEAAYLRLHRLGHAHSIEVYEGERLVGGLYGVAAGTVFCGESMFSRESSASKVALAALCRQLARWQVDLLDAQVDNPHLKMLGARPMARSEYLQRLARAAPPGVIAGSWTERFPPLHAAELA